MEKYVRLDLALPGYLVLRELIWNIRLGERNIFEEDIKALAQAIENEEMTYPSFYAEAENEYGVPKLHFEFSDDEGFVINILEE